MSNHPESHPDAAESEARQSASKDEADELHALVEGAEQQVGTGEFAETRELDQDDPRTTEQGHAQQRDEEHEEISEKDEGSLDEALDESFPASDPPSQSIPH